MFEDSDGGPGESGSQDQRGMVQFITQDQTALRDTTPTLIRINHPYIGIVFNPSEPADSVACILFHRSAGLLSGCGIVLYSYVMICAEIITPRILLY